MHFLDYSSLLPWSILLGVDFCLIGMFEGNMTCDLAWLLVWCEGIFYYHFDSVVAESPLKMAEHLNHQMTDKGASGGFTTTSSGGTQAGLIYRHTRNWEAEKKKVFQIS